MTPQQIKAMKLALEKIAGALPAYIDGVATREYLATIHKALAEQPEQEQDRQIDQLIQERDHRDEIIDKLCDAVLGPDRYEWSSQYFFEDAVREVEERIAALEKPAQQEFVAWICEGSSSDEKHGIDYWPGDVDDLPVGTKLYTTPPQRKPLTDEDLIECERLAAIRHRKHMGSIRGQQLSSADDFLWHYARAIEAAHGIKGEA